KNAVNTSYAISGPSTAPVIRENSEKLVPNSYDNTMPDTTPIPKVMAKGLIQNLASCRYCGLPVFNHKPSQIAISVAKPIVIDGKIIWKLTVKANCTRERILTSSSIVAS